ncbi:MAG: quinolinate synthetase [Bacteroidetes bacterium GWF2_40_14]|nr:MAG: quinolinate synthetase [Bacteroidetes bacterium GWF2_40_14]
MDQIVIMLIFGSLITLSFLKFTNPLKVNKRANFWLGVTFLIWASFWMEEVLLLADIKAASGNIVLVVRLIQFLSPPIFFFSVIFFTNPLYKFGFKDLKYTILPVVYFVIISIEYYGDWKNKEAIRIIILSLILFQSLLYTGISYLVIRNHQKKILLFSSDTKGINLSWLEYIIVVTALMCLIITGYNIIFYTASLNFQLNLFILAVIFFIAYYSLKQKEIYPVDEKYRRELISINQQQYVSGTKRKLMTDEELVDVVRRINDVMQLNKPYLDSELNLIKLSELLSVTPHQLSYVINTGFSGNFFHFINKFRVEEAKKLLLDNKKDNLSILGIAYESGFNSKTSFNTTFKKITGQTPSEFKKRSSIL